MKPAPRVRPSGANPALVAGLLLALIAPLSGCRSGTATPTQGKPGAGQHEQTPSTDTDQTPETGANSALASNDQKSPEAGPETSASATASAQSTSNRAPQAPAQSVSSASSAPAASSAGSASETQAAQMPGTSNRAETDAEPKPKVAVEDLPDAEEVLDASVQAMGGYPAFSKLKNRVMTGSYVLGDQASRVVVYEAEPNKSYVYTQWPNGTSSEVWTDGSVVWDRGSNGATRLRMGAAKDEQVFRAHFNRETKWQELHLAADVIGTAELDGQSYYKVLVEPLIGNKETWFINTVTKLHERTEAEHKPHPSALAVDVQTTFSDYREVDGVLRYHRLEQIMGFSKFMVTYDMMKFNIDMDERIFTLPPQIQSLIDSQRGMGVVEPGRSRLIPADPRFDPLFGKPDATTDQPKEPAESGGPSE